MSDLQLSRDPICENGYFRAGFTARDANSFCLWSKKTCNYDIIRLNY